MISRLTVDTLPGMELTTVDGVPSSGRGTTTDQRIRRWHELWITWLRPQAACLLDGGMALAHRKPLVHLAEASQATRGGVVLLLNHRHPDAMATLLRLCASHPESFEAGAVVIGIENLQAAQQQNALASYRRVAPAPVFAVDLHRVADRLLLREALVATRVAAALHRGWSGR